jgi:hypothetical protein
MMVAESVLFESTSSLVAPSERYVGVFGGGCVVVVVVVVPMVVVAEVVVVAAALGGLVVVALVVSPLPPLLPEDPQDTSRPNTQTTMTSNSPCLRYSFLIVSSPLQARRSSV